MNLGCIVEGQGDEAALPVLLRRIDPNLVIARPVRVQRGKFTQKAEVQRAVRLALAKSGDNARVLIVLDADDDCVKDLAASLHAWASELITGDDRVAVVVANREFEAWFLAGADSLRGVREIGDDSAPPDDPEGIRDAKRWLTEQMAGTRAYRETVDQPALAARVDIASARERSRSLDKLCREVERLKAMPT